MSDPNRLREFWEELYQPTNTVFDAREPDEWVAAQEGRGKIRGTVLDAGCGPGRNAFYLAGRGYRVVGVNISVNAIERAKRKAAETGSSARFLAADIGELPGYDDQFDSVVDIGCLHSLRSEGDRAAYAVTLHRVCRPGATVLLRAFSATNLETSDRSEMEHIPDLREDQIRAAFAPPRWAFESLEEREIDLVVGDSQTIKAHVWYAEIRRA